MTEIKNPPNVSFISYNNVSIIITIAFIIVIIYFSIISEVLNSKSKDKKCDRLDFIINDSNETINNCVNLDNQISRVRDSVTDEYTKSLSSINNFIEDISNNIDIIKSINENKYNTLIDDLSNNINYMKTNNENTTKDTLTTNENINNTLNDINQYLN